MVFQGDRIRTNNLSHNSRLPMYYLHHEGQIPEGARDYFTARVKVRYSDHDFRDYNPSPSYLALQDKEY